MRKKIKTGMLLLVLLSMVGFNTAQETNAASKKTKSEELTFYIVRHGKTMLNTTDRVQGWSDAVLTPEGERTAKAAGKGLKGITFQGAYSSDSGRAVQTAELILKQSKHSTKLNLQTDKRLREFNFGSYEGDLNEYMWKAIADHQGITVQKFLDTMTPKSFANSVAELDKNNVKAGTNWPAENYKTITKRLTAGLNDITKKESKKKEKENILIVSHGLSISALLNILDNSFSPPKEGFKNASVSVIRYKNGKYKIQKINDTSYLEKGLKEIKTK
ncbi:histidine phosphatase family protein [Melissococcus plutonius]|uniref:histidine phosphatase family protein n=1 Tax=Melissococcus plutonius TaxID=33970 RepID=UPI003EE62BB1